MRWDATCRRPAAGTRSGCMARCPPTSRARRRAPSSTWCGDGAKGRDRCPCLALVIAGSADPLLPPEAAVGLASTLGAEREEIPGAGHWPMLQPGWRATAAIVHRWLVRRLGEPLLDFYAEAMAERESDE